jgi:hypothetical protein
MMGCGEYNSSKKRGSANDVTTQGAFQEAATDLPDKKDSKYKVTSQGAPYEVVIVADHAQWDNAPGDTLRAIFGRRVPMVNREETMFDVLRVLPSGFKRLVVRHPNILIINVDAQFAEPTLGLRYNVYANPQIVIVADAPDNASMTELLSSHRDEIVMLLEKAERDRDLVAAKTHGPAKVKEAIRTQFGFDMDVTPGFTIRSKKDDFMWLSYEMPLSSQGIIIYTYPFSGIKDFEEPNLVRRRDEFVGLIPGENPGSHMATNPEFTELVYKKINDRSWSELQGFWDVTGDFMGGPYINYSTIDVARQRVVAIDFYVYSPSTTNVRRSQRNYKNQLQHFIYSVKIPE